MRCTVAGEHGRTGVTSLVAPVFTDGESLPLVVTLVMPARGTTEEALVGLSAELLHSTRAMAEELGYAPHNDDAQCAPWRAR
ncbi:hypothetical protein [Streptomyces sp. McG3]|uniref:hypothetical protein n=1 Tax=Streptomyces sp. McG3 TaxID=2725483 RepID=UPI001BEAE918|nr:hypothetical protein [Streptomyces sp. McG3]